MPTSIDDHVEWSFEREIERGGEGERDGKPWGERERMREREIERERRMGRGRGE